MGIGAGQGFHSDEALDVSGIRFGSEVAIGSNACSFLTAGIGVPDVAQRSSSNCVSCAVVWFQGSCWLHVREVNLRQPWSCHGHEDQKPRDHSP